MHVLIFRRKENVRRSRPSCLGLVGPLSAASASPFWGRGEGPRASQPRFRNFPVRVVCPPEPPSSKEGQLWEDTPLTRLDADPDAAALQRTRTRVRAAPHPRPLKKRGESFESALPRSRFGGARPRCEVDGLPPSKVKRRFNPPLLALSSRVQTWTFKGLRPRLPSERGPLREASPASRTAPLGFPVP